MQLDQRVQSLLGNDAQVRRFTAIALAYMLQQGGGATDDGSHLDNVFGLMNDRAGDMTSRVAGQPLSHWMGKNPSEIRRELAGVHPDTEAADPGATERAFSESETAGHRYNEIREAFAARGLPFNEPPEPDRTATDKSTGLPVQPAPGESYEAAVARVNAPPTGAPGSAIQTTTATTAAAATTTTPEPVYGRDRIPLSQLRGKTDEDLLKYPGIGKKTIEDIRAAEKAPPAPPPAPAPRPQAQTPPPAQQQPTQQPPPQQQTTAPAPTGAQGAGQGTPPPG